MKTLTPVKKILKSINECQSQEDIDKCKTLISNYLISVKKKGIENKNELKIRLNEELLERQEALYLSKIFNKD